MEIQIMTMCGIQQKCEGPFQVTHTQLDKVLYNWFTAVHFKGKLVTETTVIENA
jgi:hypothetical protein